MTAAPASRCARAGRTSAILALVAASSICGFVEEANAASYDLAIRQRSSPFKVGQASVLTISILNLGPSGISSTDSVTVVAVLPAGLVPPPPSWILPASWGCVVHGQTVTCTYAYGPSVAGRALLPEISLFVLATQPGPFTICAGVSMTTAESNTGNNRNCMGGVVKP